MNAKELNNLKNKIKILSVFNIVFLIINIFLIVIPFFHYWSHGFKSYLLIITILNIIAFYISYLIANKLVFYKNKHRHFSHKLNPQE